MGLGATRLPLRLLIPVITGLFALVVTVVSVGFNLRYGLAHSEAQSRELLTQLMNQVVADIEADNRFGGARHRENELRNMTRYRDVQQAIVFDPGNTVAHSSDYILLGQSLEQTGLASIEDELTEVRASRRPMITRDAEELVGLAPITWKLREGELLASEVGVALIRYDMSRSINGHLTNALRNAGTLTIAILMLTGFMAWFSGRILTRDVRHIVNSTRALSNHENSPVLVSPIAEFGEISDALAAAQSELDKQLLSLQFSEERFRDIVESSSGWIFEADSDWRITYSNQAVETTLGFQAEEVVGACFQDYLLPEEENVTAFRDLRAFSRFTDVLLSVVDAEGEERKLQVSGFKRESPSSLLRCVAYDRTQQLRLEEIFLQSQKMDAVGQLAGGIAHNFNNILMVILSRCELALMEEVDESTREHLSSVREQALVASQVTRRMMTVSRSGVNAPKITQVNDVITASMDLLTTAAAERVNIHLNLSSELGLVRIDQSQLQQLLLNLVLNARHAMPDGGDIYIETHMQESDSHKKLVCVTVRDTGCGIDAQIIDKIFEPFFTTRGKGDGMGLGLASVATSVRTAGGDIEVNSAPDAGSTFHIRLPEVSEDMQALDWDDDREPAGRGERVLLVEDSENLLRILGDYLEGIGYSVIRASGLVEARKAIAAELRDIVVSDIVLQDGIGTDLLEVVGDTPIVFMSGYTKPDEIRGVTLEQGQNFLHKPFSPRELGRLIEVSLAASVRARYA